MNLAINKKKIKLQPNVKMCFYQLKKRKLIKHDKNKRKKTTNYTNKGRILKNAMMQLCQ